MPTFGRWKKSMKCSNPPSLAHGLPSTPLNTLKCLKAIRMPYSGR